MANENALLVFKKVIIQSDPLQAFANWAKKSNHCKWAGVICNSKHQIIGIENQFHRFAIQVHTFHPQLEILHNLAISNCLQPIYVEASPFISVIRI